jgi:Caspase domain
VARSLADGYTLLLLTLSGHHVWAERYDRELGDIFAVQDDITQQVVAAIGTAGQAINCRPGVHRQAIGQDRIQGWLAKIRAKKSIVIFDTCESGTLAGVQLAALRGGFEQLAAIGRLIEATGRTTLTASLESQPALEGYKNHGVFTFALLDALARGDRNGDGFVSVTELIEHVDGLVPEITFKTWGRRQVPRSLFQGTNFALAEQVPGVAPVPGDASIIPTKATHANLELLQIFEDAGGKGTIVQELPPITAVTVVRTEQGWALIARDGKALGYVAEGKLQKLN